MTVELTVEEALRRIKKLCALESDGVQLIYFKEILHRELDADRERCAKIAMAELDNWNIGGEHYANVTQACSSIAAKIRGVAQ